MPARSCRRARAQLSSEYVLALGHEILEIVVQDEYTHDVIVRAPHGYLVFDRT